MRTIWGALGYTVQDERRAGGLRCISVQLWPRLARPRFSAGQGTTLAGRSNTTQQSTQQ
jgi:hypothetical protein